MRFSLKGGRSNKPTRINLLPDGAQHPDLPLSPNPQASSPKPEDSSGLARRATTSERFSSGYAGDRRSIAVEPGYDPSHPFSADQVTQEPAPLSGGLSRAQTVLRREAGRRADTSSSADVSPLWAPDPGRLPTPSEQAELDQQFFTTDNGAHMSQYQSGTPRKTSTDSGQSAGGADRWLARRLQRQTTEQGFREQRQGGQSIYTPATSLSEQSGYHSAGSGASPYSAQEQQLPFYAQQAQPHPAQPPAYQGERTAPTNANAGSGTLAQPVSLSSRTTTYSRQDSSPPYVVSSQQYPSPDLSQPNVSVENLRPGLTSTRSYTQQLQAQQQQIGVEEASMSSSNNGNLPAPKPSRSGGTNRQSMHNGIGTREGATLAPGQQTGGQQPGGVPAFNASIVPPSGQAPPSYQGNNLPQQASADVGRTKTPQPIQTSEDMSPEEVNQMIKDHKELREKYTKVKKYYFEKEDQVKQLQNSLAHQRLSQSRTSLDDSEYTTRFNRLDGLIAQLAFAIRKSWRNVPPWLTGSVNKDAVNTGKQEMTAAGRAFISCWIVEEVFEKFFHPDLDPMLSAHLKGIQRNIRHFAPFAQTAEEEEYLTSKVVNWRLSTLEGLQEELRSSQCAANRAQLTEILKRDLVGSLSSHLQEPAPPDLEGGVHMIIELVVSIASHLPLESRDVVIEYFTPGYSILHDQMKVETGIPPLTMSIADEQAEHEIDDGDSEDIDTADLGDQPVKKKAAGMLSALTGAGTIKSKSSAASDQQRKNAGAGPSSSSLNRPESAQGMRQDPVPRVRMAAGIGVQIRGRSVLVKAPVFATS